MYRLTTINGEGTPITVEMTSENVPDVLRRLGVESVLPSGQVQVKISMENPMTVMFVRTDNQGEEHPEIYGDSVIPYTQSFTLGDTVDGRTSLVFYDKETGFRLSFAP